VEDLSTGAFEEGGLVRNRRKRAISAEWIEGQLKIGVKREDATPSRGLLRRLKKNYNLSRTSQSWRSQVAMRKE
jgi:hypothetical protein